MKPKSNESNMTFLDIADTIFRKNILLIFHDDSNMPIVLHKLISEIQLNRHIPLIWVCWKESAINLKKDLKLQGNDLELTYFIDTVGNTIDDKHTILHSSKNFSGIMMSIQKLTRNKDNILVLDSIDNSYSYNKEVILSFLSFLIQKNQDFQNTIITAIQGNFFDNDAKKELMRLFNVIFLINKDKIQIICEIGRRDIFYEVKNSNILFTPYKNVDMSKITDIFHISSKDRKRLDEVAEQAMKHHKDIF